jgi:hypothetical protein
MICDCDECGKPISLSECYVHLDSENFSKNWLHLECFWKVWDSGRC